MNWCHCKALLNRAADHTITSGKNNVFFMDNTYTACARQESTPSLQALAGNRVVTFLLGHSCFLALCSLAFSQVGH